MIETPTLFRWYKNAVKFCSWIRYPDSNIGLKFKRISIFSLINHTFFKMHFGLKCFILVSTQINILENWKKTVFHSCLSCLNMVGKRKYFPHSCLGILHSFTHGINLNSELACTKSSMRTSQSRNKC